MGRDIADIFAADQLDYPALAGHAGAHRAGGSAAEPAAAAHHRSAGFDGRRLDQMTRTPKILGKQLGLAGRVPLIVMPHHDNQPGSRSRPRPFMTTANRSAVAVLDGTGDQGSVSLYGGREWRDAATLLQRQHVRLARRLLQRDLIDTRRAGPGCPARAATWAPPPGAR